MEVLKVENLTKNYEKFSLKNISFSLEKGKIYGFVGRNGAGKTTTIKSILNLIKTDSGTITYFSKDLHQNEAYIKQHIGYSTGTLNFFPKKKIKDIVEVTKRFYESWDEDKYIQYKELFSIDEEKTPEELSDGMKVKFNLLLALSHDAEILILDEPTSSLDPFSRDEIIQIFKNLKDKGTTIFFSTHIISDIEKCADDFIYIRNGEIIINDNLNHFLMLKKSDDKTADLSLEEILLELERK